MTSSLGIAVGGEPCVTFVTRSRQTRNLRSPNSAVTSSLPPWFHVRRTPRPYHPLQRIEVVVHRWKGFVGTPCLWGKSLIDLAGERQVCELPDWFFRSVGLTFHLSQPPRYPLRPPTPERFAARPGVTGIDADLRHHCVCRYGTRWQSATFLSFISTPSGPSVVPSSYIHDSPTPRSCMLNIRYLVDEGGSFLTPL